MSGSLDFYQVPGRHGTFKSAIITIVQKIILFNMFSVCYGVTGSLLTGKQTTTKLPKEKRKKTVNKSQILCL